MNQLDKKDNADLDKIDRDINFHRIMVFLILITAIFFYMIFINLKVTESAQSWGPVGDFFGGILSPIFALFAFYWLTYSVRLQIKELKETRVELAKATKAQEESAKHQEEIARLESENVKTQVEILELNKDTLKSQQDAAIAQQQQIALQNFESLFSSC
jgi:cytochrome c oxidase assembly factor CtaG